MADAVEIKKDELFRRFCRRVKKNVESLDEDAVLSLNDFLEDAKKAVVKRAFPFGYTEKKAAQAVEEYSNVVINVADYLYSKDGAAGETQHTAAGVTRQYGSAGIPSEFFYEITPEVGVLS